MTTQYVEFTGDLYYTNTIKPDDYQGVKKWCTKVVMDEENMAKYRESGIRCQIRPVDNKDPDSPDCIRFTREFSRDFRDGKGERELGRPEFVIWDNEEKKYVPFDASTTEVGNGTKAKVTVEVYDTKMGKGHRLRKIAILDFVPYIREETNEVAQESAQEAEADRELDDAIPF